MIHTEWNSICIFGTLSPKKKLIQDSANDN